MSEEWSSNTIKADIPNEAGSIMSLHWLINDFIKLPTGKHIILIRRPSIWSDLITSYLHQAEYLTLSPINRKWCDVNRLWRASSKENNLKYLLTVHLIKSHGREQVDRFYKWILSGKTCQATAEKCMTRAIVATVVQFSAIWMSPGTLSL